MFHKRVVPYPLLQAFDGPDAQQSCGRRDTTTVAPQALALLNDHVRAEGLVDFADRLLKDAGSDPERWVERGFQLALARPPSKTEREACRAFVATAADRAAETLASSRRPDEVRDGHWPISARRSSA